MQFSSLLYFPFSLFNFFTQYVLKCNFFETLYNFLLWSPQKSHGGIVQMYDWPFNVVFIFSFKYGWALYSDLFYYELYE